MVLRLGWLADVLGDSPTLRLSGQAKALLARGEPVINLTAGEPDFPTPEPIRRAAAAVLEEGRIGYTPSAGIPALRERIAEEYTRRLGVSIGPEEVIVSNGAKQVLFNALSMLLNQGDEVAVPVPYWVTYPAQVAALRARLRPVMPSRPGWKVTAADLDRAGVAARFGRGASRQARRVGGGEGALAVRDRGRHGGGGLVQRAVVVNPRRALRGACAGRGPLR